MMLTNRVGVIVKVASGDCRPQSQGRGSGKGIIQGLTYMPIYFGIALNVGIRMMRIMHLFIIITAQTAEQGWRRIEHG